MKASMVQRFPDEPEPLIDYGVTLATRGMTLSARMEGTMENGLEVLRYATRRFPDNPQVWYELGTIAGSVWARSAPGGSVEDRDFDLHEECIAA